MQIKLLLTFFFYLFSFLYSAQYTTSLDRFKTEEMRSFIARACIEGNLSIISGFVNNQHPTSRFLLHMRYDDKRNTLLHLALAHKQTEIAFYLIQQKSPVNLYNRDGWTPLHYAAEQDNAALFELLIKSGSIINAYALNGITPYGIACKYSKKNILIFCKQTSDTYYYTTELKNPGAHKAYRADEEGNLDFIGWKQNKKSPNNNTSEEIITQRQNYFLQLQKTASLPSFSSPFHINIDEHPLSFSENE